MDNNLNITIIQADLFWAEKLKNLEFFEKKISEIKETTDLIVLPEMFTTGFTMQPALYAENANGSTLQWMQNMAKIKSAAIIGSFIVEEDGKFFNRLYVVDKKGNSQYYNKRHLFRMAGEEKVFTAGDNRLIVNIKGWNICPLVCYDLRFPVWSRNNENIDLLIYIANWPKKRRTVWQILLRARAIENLCYVAGVNRVGEDGNKILYSGDSLLIDYAGTILSDIPAFSKYLNTYTLSKNNLIDFRERFPVHLDADIFTIQI